MFMGGVRAGGVGASGVASGRLLGWFIDAEVEAHFLFQNNPW